MMMMMMMMMMIMMMMTDFAGTWPRSGELRTQKLKSHTLRTQSLKFFSLKPGVGPFIAIHATLTSRDFILADFYPSGPFTYIFSKPLPSVCCISCG